LEVISRPQAPFKPLLAVLGLLLAAWFSLSQAATAAILPQDHSGLLAASAASSNLSPHQENSSLPPENRVWKNSKNPNGTRLAELHHSLQPRWENDLLQPKLTSGVPVFLNADPSGFSGGPNWFAYADGNPISKSDPFGLCAVSNNGMTHTYSGLVRTSDPNSISGPAGPPIENSQPYNYLENVQYNIANQTTSFNYGHSWDMNSSGMSDATAEVQFAIGVPGMVRGLTELGAAAVGKGLSSLGRGAATAETSFFEGTSYTPKVLNQMRGGAGEFHSFPESVTAFESAGTVRPLIGGDGVARQMLEIPGSYGNGGNGVFQFIKNADNAINHRLFVPNSR
jgi:hypothetical protein